MRSFYKLLFVLVSVLILKSCATVFSPPGGPRDDSPPQNISVSPKMLAKNVQSKKFTFEFDEFIKLDNPHNEILISPPLTHRPDFKVKGKKLIVELKDTLQENTTYTINFGSAIKDNNEGNKLQGLNYVFSTGSQIDSLSVGGNIKDALTNKGLENIGILLYPAETFTDSTFRTSKPFYYAISNAEGNFKFKYLKSGNYKAFALKDENFNLKYDIGEEVAYLDNIVKLDPDSEIQLALKLFKNEEKPKITSYSIDNQSEILISFNKRIKSIEWLEPFGLEQNLYENWNATKDTLKLAFKEILEERPRIVLKLVQNESPDTLIFRTKAFSKDSVKNLEPLWDEKKHRNKQIDLAKGIQIHFQRPVNQVFEGVYLYEDSFKNIIKHNISVDAFNPKILSISAPYKSNMRYDLIIADNMVQDYFGLGNKAFKLEFETLSREDYGNLNYKLGDLDSTKQYILEMIRDSKVYESFILKDQSSFEKEWKLLKPGKVQFRLILDKDRNEEWSSGNLQLRKQPEPIYIYPDEINIRANWDLEVEDSPNFNFH